MMMVTDLINNSKWERGRNNSRNRLFRNCARTSCTIESESLSNSLLGNWETACFTNKSHDGLLRSKHALGHRLFRRKACFSSCQQSVFSDNLRASSSSTPRYRIVLSSFECPSKICTALIFFVLA